MASWQLNINDGEEIITTSDGLFDVPIVRDTFNPFSNRAVAKLDDTDGEMYDKFPRGTRVDFEFSEGIQGEPDLFVNNAETESINNDETESYSSLTVGGTLNVGGTPNVGTRSRETRLQGFVVERREIEQSGADQLEIEVYSLDQLLRGDKVSANTEGMTISEALESIIINDTAVAWNPNNVAVEDNVELTRNLRGERVEDALLTLAFRSANERIRVNSEIEFEFFRQENTPAPRDINNTQWFHVDQPEEGKGVINEVRVWYNDGESKVTVDDGADKLALQDSLGLDDPFSTVEEISRPDITVIDDAKSVGEEILDERGTTTPITVTTFGLETAQPGEVLNVDIPEKGISDDFEIASITYDWGNDQTDLILIENTGYQADLLVRVVDSVERVELEGINRDADDNRITDTRVEALIDVSGTLDGTSFDATRFTNLGRNKLRDGWSSGTINITEIAIGDDNSSLSRTNESLGNETNRVSVSESLVGSDSVEYSGDFGGATGNEVGLFDANGDLIARAITDNSQSATNLSGTISLTINDNENLERGVFTNSGQETVRDILADNNPNLPTQYAYGEDGTTPTEADTSLGDQTTVVDLERIPLQNATTTQQWQDLVDLTVADDMPLTFDDSFEVTQTNESQEGESAQSSNFGSESSVSYSNGDAGSPFSIAEGVAEWTIGPFNHDIPATDVQLYARIEIAPDQAESIDESKNRFIFNGVELNGISGSSFSLSWVDLQGTEFVSPATEYSTGGGEDLQAGNEYKLRWEWDDDVNSGIVDARIDVVAVGDTLDRFNFITPNYTFDETLSNGYLDGPEDYPEQVDISFVTAETSRNVTSGEVDSSWNNTEGEQFIELANDGSAFSRASNSETISVNFASPETGIDTNIRLSRGGSRDTATPRTGYIGQSIDSWHLFADPSAINPSNLGVAEVEGVVPPNTIVGSRLEEAGQLASDDTLLTRAIFAAFDIFEEMSVRSAEKVSFDND